MGCSFIAGIQDAVGNVADALGPVLPIAAGAFLGPAAGALLGTSATIGAAAAGALTGGALSAAQGGNILTGALGGALGGYTGGSLSGLLSGGAGLTPAGYTLTGDAIADMGVLKDMGYSAAAAEGLINTGGAGALVSGIGQGASGGLLSGLQNTYQGISAANSGLGSLLSTGANLAGGYLQGQAAQDAAATQAQAQIRAAQITADAAKFRPVGVTTRFGASQFGFDPNTGYLSTAGYMLSPEMKAQQDKLMGVSENMLTQYQGAQGATAPMGQAAQSMMTLGNQYLATSPQEQAAKYMQEQQALAATGRERDLGGLMSKLQAQGRMGLATGATTTGMTAANPAMEAYYNALRQQDLQMASQATQGGMDYAKFGAGMVGAGGEMLSGMYGTQNAAYTPYSTALGGATNIEALGQNALTQGMALGSTATAANARSGMLTAQGMTNAANTMAPANAYSPWGSLLTGAGSALQQYKFGT